MLQNLQNLKNNYFPKFVCFSCKLHEQISANAHANAEMWPPIFFWGLINQKSAPILSAKCTFTHILKFSGKNIDKCRKSSDLSESHFGWQMWYFWPELGGAILRRIFGIIGCSGPPQISVKGSPFWSTAISKSSFTKNLGGTLLNRK